MHAAAQIEAQVHRQRADRRQKMRAARNEVQSDHEIIAEHILHHVLRFQLRVGIGEPHLQARRFEKYSIVRDIRRLQRAFDFLLQIGIDFLRRFRGRNLDGRHFAEKIWQRVNDADQQREADQEIEPEWITVHLRSGER